MTHFKEANSKIRILLVDDQQEMARITCMLLEMHGFKVQTCNSGVECIRIAEQTMPDVIMLDIGMPVMDGYSVCEHIRNQRWGKELIIFALTGYEEEFYKQRSRKGHFDEHLVKPVAHKDLAEKVIRHVSERSAK